MMKIQSFTDVITNSSSEIFMFETDISKDEVQKMLNEIWDSTYWEKHFENHEDFYKLTQEEQNKYCCCSGTGDEHYVESAMDWYKDDDEYDCDDDQTFEEFLEENNLTKDTLIVTFSSNAQPIEDFIISTFKVYDGDCCGTWVVDKNGYFDHRASEEEIKTLPKELLWPNNKQD